MATSSPPRDEDLLCNFLAVMETLTLPTLRALSVALHEEMDRREATAFTLEAVQEAVRRKVP